jgi:hypothetical protein
MHTENSGFASPTLGQHISTFRGYQILFSIRNPYINRFLIFDGNILNLICAHAYEGPFAGLALEGEKVALWLLTSLCTSVKREVEVAL